MVCEGVEAWTGRADIAWSRRRPSLEALRRGKRNKDREDGSI